MLYPVPTLVGCDGVSSVLDPRKTETLAGCMAEYSVAGRYTLTATTTPVVGQDVNLPNNAADMDVNVKQ